MVKYEYQQAIIVSVWFKRLLLPSIQENPFMLDQVYFHYIIIVLENIRNWMSHCAQSIARPRGFTRSTESFWMREAIICEAFAYCQRI